MENKPLLDKRGGYRKLHSFTFATMIHSASSSAIYGFRILNIPMILAMITGCTTIALRERLLSGRKMEIL